MSNPSSSQNPDLLFGNYSDPINQAWLHFLKFHGLETESDKDVLAVQFAFYCGVMSLYNTMVHSMRTDSTMFDMVRVTSNIRADIDKFFADHDQSKMH